MSLCKFANSSPLRHQVPVRNFKKESQQSLLSSETSVCSATEEKNLWFGFKEVYSTFYLIYSSVSFALSEESALQGLEAWISRPLIPSRALILRILY